ncbi:hypothetical protein EDD18DRAFT_1114229 [Armillaria luteobubalina]|uniref:Uncharacterized protein n=1 Tax=Armillaria luteobubalina TaxID=153913 RepID=A0AA39U5W2_9AGAR|nr:hypothetical protein EDD18DRAFT_1114229 [Armillaria luteobubalina]
MSKSSKSHSQGHSRNESLLFDDALAGDGTRVTRFEDPLIVRDSVVWLTPPQGPSSTPSAGPDLRMGIALSTPPMDIEDRESIRIPAHPYAQGVQEHLDMSQHYRLPPRALNHPYAHVRIVPSPIPVWILSPNGKVQEILSEEIRPSPVVCMKGAGANIRHSGNIFDTIGLGEALFSAGEARGSKDSRLGTGTCQVVAAQVPVVLVLMGCNLCFWNDLRVLIGEASYLCFIPL